MKPLLTACVDTPLGLSMFSNAVAKPSIRTLVRVVGPALVRLCGVLLGCMAAVGVAFWLGIMFEGEIALNSDRYHVAAFCFAMTAIAPLGWWLLFWTGPFRRTRVGRGTSLGSTVGLSDSMGLANACQYPWDSNLQSGTSLITLKIIGAADVVRSSGGRH
jgi:hypothetical protein